MILFVCFCIIFVIFIFIHLFFPVTYSHIKFFKNKIEYSFLFVRLVGCLFVMLSLSQAPSASKKIISKNFYTFFLRQYAYGYTISNVGFKKKNLKNCDSFHIVFCLYNSCVCFVGFCLFVCLCFVGIGGSIPSIFFYRCSLIVSFRFWGWFVWRFAVFGEVFVLNLLCFPQVYRTAVTLTYKNRFPRPKSKKNSIWKVSELDHPTSIDKHNR